MTAPVPARRGCRAILFELHEHAGDLGWDALTWQVDPSPGGQIPARRDSKAVSPGKRPDGYVD